MIAKKKTKCKNETSHPDILKLFDSSSNVNVSLSNKESIQEDKPIPKKRGRKPSVNKEVYEPKKKNAPIPIIKEETRSEKNKPFQDQSILDTSTVPPLILHLNIPQSQHQSLNSLLDENESTSKNTTNNDIPYENGFYEYDPNLNEPCAYEDQHSDNFSSKPETFNSKNNMLQTNNSTKDIKIDVKDPFSDTIFDNTTKKETKVDNESLTNSSPSVKTTNLLLNELISNNEWCNETSYWCFWDCHHFKNTPVGIPIKYKNEKFQVFGCFCSLECATAYNFYGRDTIDNVWENFNLINMLSNKLGYKKCVTPAISRKCLYSFGGPLSIEQFREKNNLGHQCNIRTYPMVSIVQHVEEINTSSSYSSKINSYIPLDKSKIEQQLEEAKNEKLYIKQKSVLEESMNLKFTF
jgi:hypothetical protein